MKKFAALFLAILITVNFSACGTSEPPKEEKPAEPEIPVVEEQPEEPEEKPIFTEMPSIKRELNIPENVGEIEAYGEHWHSKNNVIEEDLSGETAFTYTLTVSDRTKFVKGEPDGYDKDALIEWGKDPGLNVDVLHDLGYTGKGAVIAYVDQPFTGHEQYNEVNCHYVNNSENSGSMHGPAVLSLLAGKDIGTAPEAEIYYYAHSSWFADQKTHAECLYQIIEQNKILPEEERITMVGFSDNIDRSEDNVEAFKEAVKACEEAGIMVFFCGDYSAGSFVPMSNKNDPDNVVFDFGDNGVVVPASGRTTATTESGAEYIYFGEGGLSWTMPYVLGLYAIAGEIDPELTKVELLETLYSTATINANGCNVINPTGFVAEILRGVGKEEEASQLIEEVQKRTEYFYAVVNTEMMTEADIKAIDLYLSNIIDSKVIKVDARDFATAKELYIALKNDIAERKGTVSGIQIFGNADIVPPFSVNYRVDMGEEIDEGGEFLSDLFYGNFENDPELISEGYSAYDHFSKGLDVDIVPQWPVARLPLAKGEFSSFLKKYVDFESTTKLERLDLVNFSNSIFRSTTPVDNMGRFLNRAKNEFGILNIDYRLYGNLDGDYPTSTKVLGNFVAENLSLENEAGPAEFIINTHGQNDNIDRCIFIDGEEIRESLVNINTINTVFDDNYYYLDMWACLNGQFMKENITSEALNGKCVGMFSATAIISNNGVKCEASLSEMQKSNFYWFYYNYLKALDKGENRSDSFFLAQEAYAKAILEDSERPLRPEGNYQFNANNLLAYHNFGLIEKTSLVERSEDITAEARPEKLRSKAFSVDYTDEEYSKKIDYEDHFYKITGYFGEGEVFCVGFERTENGANVYFDCKIAENAEITCFTFPKGDKYFASTLSVPGERKIYVFNMACEELDEVETMNIMIKPGSLEDATIINFDIEDAEDGIKKPKQKSHFVCDAAVEDYAEEIDYNKTIYEIIEELDESKFIIHGASAKKTENGNIRIYLDLEFFEEAAIACFDPPEGKSFSIATYAGSEERKIYVFEIDSSEMKGNIITINFSFKDRDCFIRILRDSLGLLEGKGAVGVPKPKP